MAWAVFLTFQAHNNSLQALPYWNQQPQIVLSVLEMPYIAYGIYVYFACVNFFQTDYGQLPLAKITTHKIFSAYHIIG